MISITSIVSYYQSIIENEITTKIDDLRYSRLGSLFYHTKKLSEGGQCAIFGEFFCDAMIQSSHHSITELTMIHFFREKRLMYCSCIPMEFTNFAALFVATCEKC